MIKDLIKAGIDFWSGSQLHTGAFNEYYPFESGFPPTAFSLYAVAIILNKYPEFVNDSIIRAVNKTIAWLLKHPEKEALNQESAALAGIIMAGKLTGVKVNREKLDQRLKVFYNAQHDEGWFNEYGGPDLGYLSVTVDSLWDIYKTTKDEKALASAIKAIEFLSMFVAVSGDFPVMINSRNTDYVVPYGISGFAENNEMAASVLNVLINNCISENSMFGKTDDRYLTHYIGQSYFRTVLNNMNSDGSTDLPCKQEFENYFTGCRIFIRHEAKKSVVVSLAKGGIINVFGKNGIEKADYGYRMKMGNSVVITHWQDEDYRCSYTKEGSKTILTVEGYFSRHKFLRPSPFGHMVLRMASFCFGSRIMSILRSILIFNNKKCNLKFFRNIEIENREINMNDQFEPTNLKNRIYKAPHYSMRHVSSAGRFVIEELKNFK